MDVRRQWKTLRQLIYVHIDIPTILVLLFIVLLVHRPLEKKFFETLGWADDTFTFPVWFKDVWLGVLANVLAALIIVPVVFWLLRVRARAAVCGRFTAFDTTSGQAKEWGSVTLTYNIFSRRVRGTLTYNDVELTLDAIFDKAQYLRGHYAETSNEARRRLGAFLLSLTGEGNVYEGPFVFVDPEDNNVKPQTGTVRWERM